MGYHGERPGKGKKSGDSAAARMASALASVKTGERKAGDVRWRAVDGDIAMELFDHITFAGGAVTLASNKRGDRLAVRVFADGDNTPLEFNTVEEFQDWATRANAAALDVDI